MKNTFSFVEDSEHRAISLSPKNREIIKAVRLVYYSPNCYMPLHTHSVAQFSTLLLGQAFETNSFSEYESKQGIAEYKPIAYRHSNQIGSLGALFLSVNIDSEHEHFLSEFGQLNWNLSDMKPAANEWQNLTYLLMRPGLHVNVDFEEVILSLMNTSSPFNGKVKIAPSWLKLAEQALNESFMNSAQIAEDVGVHRVHLSRVFQAHYGMSITQYRHRVAIQRSITSMLSHQEDISSASVSAGFADQSHFTRVLKKQFNVTPVQLKTVFSSLSQ